MASADTNNFDLWLRKTLIDLNSDDDVMSPYIISILDTDDPPDEKKENLQELIEGITDTGIEEICKNILQKWTSYREKASTEIVEKDPMIDVNLKLSKLITDNTQTIAATKVKSQEERAMKAAILAQYAEVSDEEEETEEPSLVTINNAGAVAQAEKDKRDKEKEEAQKKKEKDKEDRAKQKSKDEDRKEKEKKRTQKGERRR